MNDTLVFDKEKDAYVIKPGEPQLGELQQAGMLGGITKIEVMGIPIGAAAIGGGVAFVTDALFDRFLPQLTGSVANLVAAWAIMQFGHRFLGDAARYAAIFLAYEAVRGPIENALGGIVKPAASQVAQQLLHQQGFEQTGAVDGGYYTKALGG